jgi:hypothetical protein
MLTEWTEWTASRWGPATDCCVHSKHSSKLWIPWQLNFHMAFISIAPITVIDYLDNTVYNVAFALHENYLPKWEWCSKEDFKLEKLAGRLIWAYLSTKPKWLYIHWYSTPFAPDEKFVIRLCWFVLRLTIDWSYFCRYVTHLFKSVTGWLKCSLVAVWLWSCSCSWWSVERRIPLINAPASYSERPRLKSRPGHRLS